MSADIDRLHRKLVSVLIKWDETEARKEAKRGHVNIYRMGHFLKAAQQAEEEAKVYGTVDAYRDAVMHHFTPSPRIRTFLKKNVDHRVDSDGRSWLVDGKRI